MNTAQIARTHRTVRQAPPKEERVAVRLSAAFKKLFQQAARLEGMTLTEFVINSAKAAAKRVVQEHEVILLSDRDRHLFMDAFLNPPEPNKKLRAAFERYQQSSKTH